MKYEVRILNALLNSYENSLLSRGENKVVIHVSLSFTRKSLPEYFDESSMAFEEIHAAVGHLEELGYIEVVWKENRKNHIIKKVLLCEEKVQEIYRYLDRTPKKKQQEMQIKILKGLREECDTPVSSSFCNWLTNRIQEGKSVKEYIDLKDTQETKCLLHALSEIEKNQNEIYVREFSVRCFGDSKMLEKRWNLLGKIIRRFSENYDDMNTDAIFAEHGIYHTPNYVYVKGTGTFRIGQEGQNFINLKTLKQGIGLSGEDLDSLEWLDTVSVKKVITIENLTTFFRWEEPDSILIYLGGYHNALRRKLLRKLYHILPEAQYLHFGDIDVGGFEIYQDLCKRTEIPFSPYRMGIKELKEYHSYTKKLTENDRKRLDDLLKKDVYRNVWPVLAYMKEQGEKLEQECILCKNG
ncbi:MAG: DUF2220 family protein [Lachnospiraceae bacterium]|nr:DUF2220 family protein [Lachnospiraceae bacterium]